MSTITVTTIVTLTLNGNSNGHGHGNGNLYLAFLTQNGDEKKANGTVTVQERKNYCNLLIVTVTVTVFDI